MINQIKLKVTCIHCLGVDTKKIYPVINEHDLDTKNSIFNEDLFLYRCPHCGHYQKIFYECIYYDEQLKYAVILGNMDNKVLKKFELELSDYQIYFVEDISQLKEKIIIRENSLDDRVIEIMKHDIRTSLGSRVTYDLVINDKLGFDLVYPSGEVIKTYPFSQYNYLFIQSKYKDYLNSDYKIDKLFKN